MDASSQSSSPRMVLAALGRLTPASPRHPRRDSRCGDGDPVVEPVADERLRPATADPDVVRRSVDGVFRCRAHLQLRASSDFGNHHLLSAVERHRGVANRETFGDARQLVRELVRPIESKEDVRLVDLLDLLRRFPRGRGRPREHVPLDSALRPEDVVVVDGRLPSLCRSRWVSGFRD